MKSNWWKVLVAVSAVVVLAVLPVKAQVTTGSVTGTVVDQQGAVIPGATVRLTNQETGVTREQESNEQGTFQFDRVRPGLYTVSITRQGFRTSEVTDLVVRIGKVTSVSRVTLEVGATAETVTVTETAAPLMQAESAQISGNYSTEPVSEVNWGIFGLDALAFLTAGVQPGFGNINTNTGVGAGAGFFSFTQLGSSVSSNGLRSRFTNFTLDGQDNNDIAVGGPAFFVDIPDTVEEYQITTNQFNADQGRNLGASVNVVTKSGTNQVHGSAWWFHGNDQALSTTSSDASRQGQGEPEKFIDNQFGFTFGGPIIPDKAFGFGAYQGIQQSFETFVDPTAEGLDPSPQGLALMQSSFGPNNGVIGNYVAQNGFGRSIGSPFCQTGRLAGQTPASLGAVSIDPTNTFAFFDLFQLDSTGAIVANEQVPFCSVGRSIGGSFKQWELMTKIDVVTQKQSIGGKYLIQQFAFGPLVASNSGASVNIPGRSQYVDFYHTYQLSPRMLNEFRFNYGRIFFAFQGATGTTISDPLQNPLNTFILGPFNALGEPIGFPQGRVGNNFQFQDNWSLVWGKHTFRAGLDVRRIRNQDPILFFANGLGVGAFGLGTFFNSGGLTPNSFACLFSGFTANECAAASYEELISNQLEEIDLDFAPFTFNVFHTHQFYYFQDDIRVKPNFTLNVGIRYEHSGQPVNRIAKNLVERESDPLRAFWLQSLPLEARTIPQLDSDDNNWAPRIGFSYSPRFGPDWLFGQQGETVIRGGYGLAYDVGFENPVVNIATGAPRVFFQIFFPGPPIPGTGTGEELLADPNFAPNFNSEDPRLTTQILMAGHLPGADDDLYNPYAQQWSLGIQREVKGTVAEVRYVGTRGIGLFSLVERNPDIDLLFANFPEAVPDGIQPTVNVPGTGIEDVGDLFPNRAQILMIAQVARSEYHGLQTRWDFRNLFDQVTGGVSYTFSKNIDNQSGLFDFGSFDAGSFNDQQNPFEFFGTERALSNFDLRNAFTFWFSWDFPFHREQRGFLGKLFGGWQLGGQGFIYSGRPWTTFEGDSFNSICDEFDPDSGPGGDDCRSFVFNPEAPLDSVGQVTVNIAGNPNGCADREGNAAPCDSFRWILNNDNAVALFGTPFGVARNTQAGDGTVLFNGNLFKNTLVRPFGEKEINVQFRFQAVNIFNHRNHGIPSVDPDEVIFADEGENNTAGRILRFGLRFVW